MPCGNERIKEIRQSRGLSLVDLSVMSSVSVRTLQFAESGKRSLKPATLHDIAVALRVDYEEIIQFEPQTNDAFKNWPWSLSQLIQSSAVPGKHCFCDSEEDAKHAISAMRSSWTYHLKRGESVEDERFKQADDQLNEQFHDYEKRYLEIWRKNPNSILFSTMGKQRSGVCVVLPVTEKAYHKFRNGEISFMQIYADDIVPHSQYLILDSAVEIPCDADAKWYRLTDSLSFILFFQIALLSTDTVDSTFRMGAFGASPINLDRLSNIGFSRCGVEMPDYGFEVCEFAGESIYQTRDEHERATATTHLASMFKRLSLRNAKRFAIKRSLKMYSSYAKNYMYQIQYGRKDEVA